MRIYSRMAYTYWFRYGRIPCAWAHFREMNLAERYPVSLELAQAYSEHAPVMTMLPAFSRGIQYAEKSLAIRRQLGDLWGQGQSLHFLGVALYGSSRFEDCMEKCREAVQIMERTGDRWEVNTANWHIAYCLYRLGDLGNSIELSKRVLSEALEIGDYSSAGIALSALSKASGGRIPKDILERILKTQGDDIHTTAEILQAKAIFHLNEKNFSLAISDLKKAHAMVTENGFSQEYVAPILPWLATVLRIQLETATNFQPRFRRRILSEAFSVARRALKIAKQYKNNLPHVLRELGYLSAIGGKHTRARSYFEQSLRIATEQGAKYERARTSLAIGRVGAEVPWLNAEQTQDSAIEQLFELGANLSLESALLGNGGRDKFTYSLVDRFDSVLKWGRRIASCQTKKAVYAEIQGAASDLLRGENCAIIELEKNPDSLDFPAALVRDHKGFGLELIQQALSAGKPVITSENKALLVSSGMPTRFRSALCAPILVRGKIRVCFGVSHSQINNLFREEEEQLAAFIAAIAGAALENFEAFEGLKDRTEKLIASNSELERFAFVASHDLKEPLRVIRLSTEFLSDHIKQTLDDQSREYLSFVISGATRLQRLVDELLVYSRLSSNEQLVELFDAKEAVQAALENLKVTLEETHGRVFFQDLPMVTGNRSQLVQLFQNLIGNALKFRRSGEPPRIEIEARRNSQEWIFGIHDNGIGFDPKFSENIFVLFQKLHSKDEYPGTGIGLATCKRIVERHGGRIWAHSQPNRGSDFYFTLTNDSSSH